MTVMSTTKRARARWAFPVVAAGLLGVALWGLSDQRAQGSADAYAQQVAIYELQSQVAALAHAQESAGQSAVALDAGAPSSDPEGVAQRLASDRDLMGEVLGTMFTWGGHEEYVAAREALTARFGLPGDSGVLATLMPEAPSSVDSDGNVRGYIDAAGLNSSLGAFTVTPTAVRGGQYSYLVTASILSKSSDGSATASRANVLEVMTETGGKIVSIQGWSAPKAARSSGSASR